jgi:hypothetical protein
MAEQKKTPAHPDTVQEPADQEQLAPDEKKAGRPKEIVYALDKKFTLLLPKEVHKALKIRSAELEVPMTTMIIDAIKKTYDI